MDKERFIELLSADNYSEQDLQEIINLLEEDPWFSNAHFLKLKIEKSLGLDNGEDLGRIVAFSNDRRHLYYWLINKPDQRNEAPGLLRKELEFLGGKEGSGSPLLLRRAHSSAKAAPRCCCRKCSKLTEPSLSLC